MTKNLLKIEFWLWNLVRAFVTGSIQAGGAALGVAGADAVGIKMPELTIRQIGVIFIWGGIAGTILYLSKSPLPDINIQNGTTNETTTSTTTTPQPPAA